MMYFSRGFKGEIPMNIEVSAKKFLHNYHSSLYELFGIVTDWIDGSGKHHNLCPKEHCTAFCRMIMSTNTGNNACVRSTIRAIEKAKASGQIQLYECHAGMVDAVIPLFIEGRYIGSLSTGQFLLSKPSMKHFKKVCKLTASLPLDREGLKKCYFRMPYLEKNKCDNLLTLVSLVGEYVIEMESRLVFLESVDERKPIHAARKYMESHFSEKLSIPKIAAKINVSESSLSHLFKKETNTTPIQYLNEFRVKKAIDLLTNTNLLASEIADRVGFQSLPNFDRVFRKITGMTPAVCKKCRIR